jgi:polyphenol oxidase
VIRIELPAGASAQFTARAQGNLSSVGGEGAERGEAARERLRERLGVRRLVRGHQVHGTVVRRVREGPAAAGQAPETNGQTQEAAGPAPEAEGQAQEADGQATAVADVGVMVLVADCLPVVLGAHGAVAVLHAGWRGLRAGVLEEGVRALRDVGGHGDVIAIIGPGAGVCCYEVGEEVHTSFGGVHRHGRHIDLKAIARDRLLAAGVAEVTDVETCTICDERLFSHRREGVSAGRQAAVAWLS